MSTAGTPTAPQRPTGAWLGVGMILLTLAGWTSIPLFLRHFAKLELDAWAVNGWRYAFSALMWLPVLGWHWLRGSTPPGLWKAALWPSVFNAVAQVCFGLAPYYIDPGLMTFSLRLQVVFLMFGAAVFFPSERRMVKSPLFIAGIAMLLIGTTLTLLFKPGGLGEAKTEWGVILAVSSGVLYAAYALCVRKFMHGIPALTAFSAVSQYTGAALFGAMLVVSPDHGASILHLPGNLLFQLALSAIIGIGIGHTLYYASIQRLGLAVSSGVVQLQPVTVSIGAMILFGEALTGLQWVTGLIAITGAVLMLAAQQVVARRLERERQSQVQPATAVPAAD
ncbi:MAG TPA: DMT family transporter [Phycisphaerales bacterium]|nr:DMT family transporter [Phycisphaerales bacterium]